jgi:hypothetical protein
MNFVLSEWARLCASLPSESCCTVAEILDKEAADRWICIKHDVETDVTRAVDQHILYSRTCLKKMQRFCERFLN